MRFLFSDYTMFSPGTYIEKVIAPDVVKLLAAKFGEFNQAVVYFGTERSAPVGGEVVLPLLVD